MNWNADDSTDYLSAGWWIHFANQRYPDIDPFNPDSAVYIFVDGAETDPRHQPPLPMYGTASYIGGPGGRCLYRYRHDWGRAKGKISSEEFAATMTLDADFVAGTIEGCLACEGDIEVRRLHLASEFKTVESEAVELLARPRDYELHLAPTRFNPDGAFDTDEGVAVTHPSGPYNKSPADSGEAGCRTGGTAPVTTHGERHRQCVVFRGGRRRFLLYRDLKRSEGGFPTDEP